MSFFKNLLGSSEENQRKDFWNIIQSEDDLQKAIQASYEKKTIIFKHSTRCFISKTVLKNFENEMEELQKDYHFYFLDLLAYRSISNKIADGFEIRHESPQVIVLENGNPVKNFSHQSISLKTI